MKRFFVLAAAVGLLTGVGAVAQEHCKQDGQLAFCQWPSGCFTVNNEYSPNIGKACTDLIAGCKKDGTLYLGSSVPSALSAAPYGEGAQCSAMSELSVAAGSVVVDQCKNSAGDQLFCQWETGCYAINNGGDNAGKTCAQLTASCEEDGQMFTGVTGLDETNDYGKGVQCSQTGTAVGGGNTTVEQCKNSSGAQLYCQWNTGCYAINNSGANAGKTCTELTASCETDGQMFTGVTGLNASNEYGKDVQCAEAGGTPVGGGPVVEQCKNSSGKQLYCQWETGCYAISNGGENAGKTCAELISSCSQDGKLFTDVTGLNASNEYGKDVQCAQAGGSPVSVKLIANKAAAPNLKISYAKNRVTVNWNAGSKLASGTVQLLNVKGVAVSTAFIKANSGKVSVKLGTVGVPAGMYFVHINAVGVNGKKIVTNSAISIVK
ncbi:hypothetical protein R80B4_01355 [Fibrobacteres bacterium R8-0-B4]